MGTLAAFVLSLHFIAAQTPIAAVPPAQTLLDIPIAVSRNAYFYNTRPSDPTWVPVTFIFGPWEHLPDAHLPGGGARPMQARVALICPGRSEHCMPIEGYIEVKVSVYAVEYQYHPTALVLTSSRRTALMPLAGTNAVKVDRGFTRDLPVNWMPGEHDGVAVQLQVVDYVSGGEYMMPILKDALATDNSEVFLGEIWGVLTPALRDDLDKLLKKAAPTTYAPRN